MQSLIQEQAKLLAVASFLVLGLSFGDPSQGQTEMVENPDFNYWASFDEGASVTIESFMATGDTPEDDTLKKVNRVTWIIKEKWPNRVDLEGFSEIEIGAEEPMRIRESSSIPKMVAAERLPSREELGEEELELAAGTFSSLKTRTTHTVDGEMLETSTWWSKDVPGGVLRTLVEHEVYGVTNKREMIAFTTEKSSEHAAILRVLDKEAEQYRLSLEDEEDEDAEEEFDQAYADRRIAELEEEIEALAPEQPIKVLYKRGDLYKWQRNYPQALASYVEFFEASRDVEQFEGVRRSFLLSKIIDLGEVYPAALRKLEDMKSALETKILAFEAVWMDLIEWQAITGYLTEDDAEPLLDFYKKLKGRVQAAEAAEAAKAGEGSEAGEDAEAVEAREATLFDVQYLLRGILLEAGYVQELRDVSNEIFTLLNEAEALDRYLTQDGLLLLRILLELDYAKGYNAVASTLIGKTDPDDVADLYREMWDLAQESQSEAFAQGLRERAEKELAAEHRERIFGPDTP